MLKPTKFSNALIKAGIKIFSGVPCSMLAPLIDALSTDERIEYLSAVNEGQAIALAAGAALTGQATAVLMQNSGLCNALDPITSLLVPFELPTLLIISHRGSSIESDANHHMAIGNSLKAILQALSIPFSDLDGNDLIAEAQIYHALRTIKETGKSFALIVGPSLFETEKFSVEPPHFRREGIFLRDNECVPPSLTRKQAIGKIIENRSDNCVVLSTTGKTSRELFEYGDRSGNFYMPGSMGHICGIATTLSRRIKNPIIILDGDGAALMHMGAFAMTGQYGAQNILHIILDNGRHDSTGGQYTVSRGVRFAQIATACGYAEATETANPSVLAKWVSDTNKANGPRAIHYHILPGSDPNLSRPSVSEIEQTNRLLQFIQLL